MEQAKEEKQYSLSKATGVLKQQKPLQLRQKQYQIKKTKLNDGAYTCPPKKQGTIFQFNSRMCIKKKSGSCKKQFTLQQSLPLFEVEWSKTIKFNYV